MGRAAVYDLLRTSEDLIEEGISDQTLWPMFSLDISPRTQNLFVVLRWGAEQSRFGTAGGKRNLDVWAYQPRQFGVDYAKIDRVLSIVVRVMTDTVHYEGSDGSLLVTSDFLGFSPDAVDPGWDAVGRSAQFSVLCREPAAG